nr:hypothetical protein [Tanacetum cinerariifolium]
PRFLFVVGISGEGSEGCSGGGGVEESGGKAVGGKKGWK